MYKSILLYLAIGYILFEIIEHIIWPFIWYLITRKRRPVCGPESMMGEMVEIRTWQEDHWKVLYKGQLWNATSDEALSPGDRVIIKGLNGLTLLVTKKKSI
jgi:membrane-bound ClpP family serine protease